VGQQVAHASHFRLAHGDHSDQDGTKHGNTVLKEISPDNSL
jgi:hypothetical protein